MSGKKTKRAAARKAKEPAKKRRADPAEESSWERFKANVRTIGGAVLLAVFIRIVLFEAFEIDGPSMQPTLLHGDRVVVAKMLYGLYLPQMDEAVLTWGEPHRGDVVIVRSPADEVDIVKRVIGVAGDTVEVREGVVYHSEDGEEHLEPVPQREVHECLEAEEQTSDPFDDCHVYEEEIDGVRYLISMDPTNREIHDQPPMDVPPGHVFVLGDHRDHSNDSRNPLIGAVPISRVKGKALFIYLSIDADADAEGWVESLGIRWGRFFDGVR